MPHRTGHPQVSTIEPACHEYGIWGKIPNEVPHVIHTHIMSVVKLVNPVEVAILERCVFRRREAYNAKFYVVHLT
jgi:hypothetical protein